MAVDTRSAYFKPISLSPKRVVEIALRGEIHRMELERMESEKEVSPDDPETGAPGAAGGGEEGGIEVPVALPVSDGAGLVTAKAEEGEFC